MTSKPTRPVPGRTYRLRLLDDATTPKYHRYLCMHEVPEHGLSTPELVIRRKFKRRSADWTCSLSHGFLTFTNARYEAPLLHTGDSSPIDSSSSPRSSFSEGAHRQTVIHTDREQWRDNDDAKWVAVARGIGYELRFPILEREKGESQGTGKMELDIKCVLSKVGVGPVGDSAVGDRTVPVVVEDNEEATRWVFEARTDDVAEESEMEEEFEEERDY